jgi:hypothetical protein
MFASNVTPLGHQIKGLAIIGSNYGLSISSIWQFLTKSGPDHKLTTRPAGMAGHGYLASINL